MIKLVKKLLVMLILLGISPYGASATIKHNRYIPGVNKIFSIVRQTTPLQRKKLKTLQRTRLAQSAERKISPSAALRAAQRTSPGSRGLGVRYMRGKRGYIVKLKTRGGVLRVFVDARTGRVRR